MLPVNYRFMEPQAVFHDTEDCMGDFQQYWSRSVMTAKNRCLIGYGKTAVEATNSVIDLALADSHFENQTDQVRLDTIVKNAKSRGRFYDNELVDVIEILAKRS